MRLTLIPKEMRLESLPRNCYPKNFPNSLSRLVLLKAGDYNVKKMG